MGGSRMTDVFHYLVRHGILTVRLRNRGRNSEYLEGVRGIFLESVKRTEDLGIHMLDECS
jgi:hypothetical protein